MGAYSQTHDTQRGSRRKDWVFPLGEVRKLGQAESLYSCGGEGETQKASHQFLTHLLFVLFSSFLPHWAPNVSCLCKCTARKLPLDSAPMLDTYISALLDNTNREVSLCSFSLLQQVFWPLAVSSCKLFSFIILHLTLKLTANQVSHQVL